MEYKPLEKLTGKYKTLNEELRKNDNKHLRNMLAPFLHPFSRKKLSHYFPA